MYKLCYPSAANDIDQDSNDSEYQKYVDETNSV
jgi:hypothetical protein